MYKIVGKRELTNNIYLMEIEAPRVAKSAQPGQFIIIKNDEKGERIPLTIADYNREKGTVTIVFQTMGKSTKELAEYSVNDCVSDFVGPLGQPSELVHEDLEELKNKKLIFVAGGVGAAPVYPQVKWMHENGIAVDVILGSRNKDLLIYEEELKKVAGNLYVATDDGSYG
ncbi:sulfide/dihydroorotate dehydrogenase-like FAD/NAD-binding protein, partial [Clostridium uliginosum]